MNSIRNKVNLLGNLGKAPQIKNVGDSVVMNVPMATNWTKKNTDGTTEQETTWHNLVAYGKVANMFEAMCKLGTSVAVEGRLVSRSYVDKNGSKRFITEVLVREFLVLSNGNNWEES